MKLMVRKHVCVPPCRNVVPMESHIDGQNVGYFLRSLRTVLLALGSSESPLFIRTHTFGVYMWWSMRGLRLIISAASTKWLGLLHQGGRLRQAWERHPKERWLFYGMKRMSKWHIHSTATSWAELKKARKLWYCLLEVTTAWDASPIKWSWLVPWSEIWMKLSRRSSYWESMRRSWARRSQNWRLYARSW
jgi:hypothetical protein